MTQSSPVNTVTAGAVTAAVTTLIAAVVKHFNIDLSADAQVSLAVGIVTAAHWAGQQLKARSDAKAAKATPAAPAQPVALQS